MVRKDEWRKDPHHLHPPPLQQRSGGAERVLRQTPNKKVFIQTPNRTVVVRTPNRVVTSETPPESVAFSNSSLRVRRAFRGNAAISIEVKHFSAATSADLYIFQDDATQFQFNFNSIATLQFLILFQFNQYLYEDYCNATIYYYYFKFTTRPYANIKNYNQIHYTYCKAKFIVLHSILYCISFQFCINFSLCNKLCERPTISVVQPDPPHPGESSSVQLMREHCSRYSITILQPSDRSSPEASRPRTRENLLAEFKPSSSKCSFLYV